MGRLEGKTAIVTGGARGMGAATCRKFVAEGARVAITDVLEEEGAALAGALGDSAVFIALDVTLEDQWERAVAETQSAFGPVDILVNNAGILLFSTLLETSAKQLRQILDVNLVGQFLGLKAVAPGMVERGKGAIVNISSVDGMVAANCVGAYSASKWGIRGLSRAAALELGHQGVRVNSVHPGGNDTAMANPQNLDRSMMDKAHDWVPMQRIGTPEEVANVTAFIASDEASYMCGAEVTVDGGMIAGHYYKGFPGAPESLV